MAQLRVPTIMIDSLTHYTKLNIVIEVCLHLPAPDIMLAEVQTVQVAWTTPALSAPPLHLLHHPCTSWSASTIIILHFLHPTPQHCEWLSLSPAHVMRHTQSTLSTLILHLDSNRIRILGLTNFAQLMIMLNCELSESAPDLRPEFG